MESKALNADWTVNQVLKKIPGTAPILNRLGIDTCCGGHLTLAEQARQTGVDLPQLLKDLEQAMAGDPPK